MRNIYKIITGGEKYKNQQPFNPLRPFIISLPLFSVQKFSKFRKVLDVIITWVISLGLMEPYAPHNARQDWHLGVSPSVNCVHCLRVPHITSPFL